MARYVVSVGTPGTYNGIVITAGTQGFTLVGFDITNSSGTTATVTLTRASGVSGGSSIPVTPLMDGGPSALSTALDNPTRGGTAQLGQWQVFSSAGITTVRYPGAEQLWVAPGHSISLDAALTPGLPVNIYIQE
jgi:hypothetical protein